MSLCTVGPGRDYPTLFAAEAANFGLASAVLTEALVVECFPMEDTAACTVSGFTTTATYDIEIRTAFGYEHSGEWSDLVYRMLAVTATALTCSQRYTTVIGLQFDVAPTSTNYIRGWTCTTLNNVVARCIARGTNGTAANSGGFRPAYASTGCAVVDCLAYDFDNTGGVGIILGANGASCYSCTVYNCTIGVSSAGSSCISKNTICMSCGDGFSGTFSASCDNNTSDIASDAPGTNATTGSVQFVSAGTYDFHLHASDTVARGTGGDLAADFAALGIDLYDIDLQAITTWSRGADIQAGAAGAGSQNLSAALFAESVSFPAPVVSPGPVSIFVSLFSESVFFPTATVATGSGPQGVNPARFVEAVVFPAPALLQQQRVSVPLFSETIAFPLPVVVGGSLQIEAALFFEAVNFSVPLVSAQILYTPDIHSVIFDLLEEYMAFKQNIKIEQGATFELIMTCKDANNVATPLTGCTAAGQVRYDYKDPLPAATFTAVVDEALGTVTLTLSSAATSALTKTVGVWDCELTHPGGVVQRLAEGKVSIYPQVTR